MHLNAGQNPTTIIHLNAGQNPTTIIHLNSGQNLTTMIQFDVSKKSYTKLYAWDFNPHHGYAIRILYCGSESYAGQNPTQQSPQIHIGFPHMGIPIGLKSLPFPRQP